MAEDAVIRVLGVDPDTGGSMGGTGIALVTTKRVLAVGVAVMPSRQVRIRATTVQRRVLGKLLRRVAKVGPMDRCIIEMPMDYGALRYADPNDLMRLSLISGAAAAVLDEFCDTVQWVSPGQWKGNRSKSADWRNTLTYFGWDYEWSRKRANALPEFEIPKGVVCLSEITAEGKKEIADALGLAYYGLVKEGAD